MERRVFLTGLLGVAGAATLPRQAQALTIGPLDDPTPASGGILPELQAEEAEATEEGVEVAQRGGRGGRGGGRRYYGRRGGRYYGRRGRRYYGRRGRRYYGRRYYGRRYYGGDYYGGWRRVCRRYRNRWGAWVRNCRRSPYWF